GNGGAGTVWTINNGNWASTWSNNGGPVSAAVQAPRNAELIEGTYDFAISVHAVNDTTNEVRWYMIEEDTKYWFGGIIKAPATTKKFNSILFGVNEVEYTQFNVIAMKVDKGDPIDVPKAPWQDFYVDTWGIYGGNNGGWNLVPGEFTGNVDLAGTAAPSGWAVVRGDLGTVNLEADVDMLLVEGKIVLEGGGFEGPASLRFGVFQGGAAGNLDSTETGYNWNGAGDADTGYLMLAQEGSNGAEAWGTGSGTWGQVANDVWNNFAGGTALQSNPPSATTGGAGEYEFQINVAPLSDGTSDVRWILKKGDGSYYMEGRVLDSAPLTSFNSLVVGVGDGATATSLLLRDVEVSMTDELIPTSVTGSNSTIPDHFSLEQNYPNPFNPTTTIEYALPENSEVTLKIYDVTGRVVTELIKGQQNAGYHKVVFDASHLATGVYFFKLEANDFTNVKKLMLIK
ncbi:T9SS type A sorting domain-containing protein, partial [candidate division KSB1 bacterium]|nr:T9SS type A sorting domain-containing protein [candidate division KSB1 bacterium]